MMDWATYRGSGSWLNLKADALARAGYQCECVSNEGRCSSVYGLEMHHDRYPQFFPEGDKLSNVRILCRQCHERFHSVSKTMGWFIGNGIHDGMIEWRSEIASEKCCHDVICVDISLLCGNKKC